MGLFHAIGLTFKTVEFAGRVGLNMVSGVINGAASTMGTVADVLDDVNHKRYEDALNRVGQHVEGVARGVGAAIENSCRMVDEVIEERSLDKFMSPVNASRMAQAAMLGLGTGLAVDVMLGDDAGAPATVDGDSVDSVSAADAALAHNTGLDPDAVQNGVFVGDSDDLNTLIAAGEDPDAQHVDSSEVTRSAAVQSAYLDAHGLEEAPANYDFHHIQPLSQGGTDTVDNLILVPEDDHATITAAHSKFYDWNG